MTQRSHPGCHGTPGPWYRFRKPAIQATLLPRSSNRVLLQELRFSTGIITASFAKSRLVIRTVPNDTPEPNVSDFVSNTLSMQVLKTVGARIQYVPHTLNLTALCNRLQAGYQVDELWGIPRRARILQITSRFTEPNALRRFT